MSRKGRTATVLALLLGALLATAALSWQTGWTAAAVIDVAAGVAVVGLLIDTLRGEGHG